MIEDDELRELFKLESEDHLQEITEGLLALEKQPDDAKALDMVYRKAHIIKGSAVMVGEEKIVKIAHLMEEYLASVKDGRAKFTTKKFDLIYEGLDAIRPLVQEAIYGTPANIDLGEVLSRLQFGAEDDSDSELVSSESEIEEQTNNKDVQVKGEIIEDDELRELFKLESEDHLQDITEGLLKLEKQPDDVDALDLVYRKAHIIKGSAVMVGKENIVKIAHLIEEYLASVKTGNSKFTSKQFDLIYEGLDAIRPLVKEAIYGTPPNVDMDLVLSRLQFGVDEASDSETVSASALENEPGIKNEEADESIKPIRKKK